MHLFGANERINQVLLVFINREKVSSLAITESIDCSFDAGLHLHLGKVFAPRLCIAYIKLGSSRDGILQLRID